MKEWERKFDEDQKIKEDTLIQNFYKETEDKKQDPDSSKLDNELNNNEIEYEKSETNNNDSYINEDDKK